MNIEIFYFICSLATPSPECTPITALRMVQGPVVANEIACFQGAQETQASKALPYDLDTEYMKISCVRTNRHISDNP